MKRFPCILVGRFADGRVGRVLALPEPAYIVLEFLRSAFGPIARRSILGGTFAMVLFKHRPILVCYCSAFCFSASRDA